MKPKMIGCINACGTVVIFQGKKPICTTLDTPNAIAAAFKKFPKTTHSKGGLVKDYKKEDLADRLTWIKVNEFEHCIKKFDY